jgi:hypothetical protein
VPCNEVCCENVGCYNHRLICLEVRYRIHCFSTLDLMLSNSMQQSPSWRANTPQLIKKFLLPTPPHFMEREGSLLHSQKPDTSVSWTRWIHSIPSSHLLKIHFNFIIQSVHGSSKLFHSQHLFISKFYMHVRRWERVLLTDTERCCLDFQVRTLESGFWDVATYVLKAYVLLPVSTVSGLWYPKIRYRIHTNPPLERIPSQMNPLCTRFLYDTS